MKTKQEIEDFLRSLDAAIDFLDYIDIDNIDPRCPFDSIYKMIEDAGGFTLKIEYYDNAVKYLIAYDPQGIESKRLAASCGYTDDKLSVTVAASLLLSERTRQQFLTLKDKIDNFFKN
jgi:hypothetical protein